MFDRALRLAFRNFKESISIPWSMQPQILQNMFFTWREKLEDINADHLIFHVRCTSEGRHYSNLLTSCQ